MKFFYNNRCLTMKKLNLVYSREYKNMKLISDGISRNILNRTIMDSEIPLSQNLIDLKTIEANIDFKKEIKIGSESNFYKDLLDEVINFFDKQKIIEEILSIKELIKNWIYKREIKNLIVETKTEDFDKILKTFFEILLEDKKVDKETLRFFYTIYTINSYSKENDVQKFLIIEDIDKFELKHLKEIIEKCYASNIITFLIFNSNKNFINIFNGNLFYFQEENLIPWEIDEELIVKIITSEKWIKNKNVDKAIFSHDLSKVLNKQDFKSEKLRISSKISNFLLNIIDNNINKEIYNDEIKETINLIQK